MKIAVFQGPAQTGDTVALMQETAAAAGDADILIFPELFITGYNIGADAVRAAAQPRDGAAARAAASIAARRGLAIAYGYPESADGCIYNAVMLIDRNGAPRAHYRKTHLFGEVDRGVFTAGASEAVLTEIAGFSIGFLICYDVEFPEAVRTLALAGADLVIVPTAQMQPYNFVPRSLIPARAYENSLFVAYANRCGQEGDFIYTGESCIVGPDGECLARAGTGEAMITAALDAVALAEARRLNSFLADRRPDLYGALTA